METRASHILVGSFVLVFLAGLVAFAVWIAKVDLDAEYTDYDIYFEGSVSGLYKRSIVYYSGIAVGDVRDITLAPHDAQLVRVWIRLRSEVPITTGVEAKLEFQGLTGVAYIEITGGPPGGKPIIAGPEDERAVIPAGTSAFQAVYEGAPNLIKQTLKTIVQIQKVLADENVKSLSNTLKNTEQLTSNLARATTDLDSVVAEARVVLVKATEAAENISRLAANGNALLEKDGEQVVHEAIKAMQSATDMIKRIDNLVAANEATITQFVSGSLPEVSKMIVDLRATAQSLSRLMKRLEQDPAKIIFGAKDVEYDLKSRSIKEDKK